MKRAIIILQCLDKVFLCNKHKESALGRVPGRIVHVDMDLEHGILVYEIFILTSQNRIFEVEILAKSGRILKIEEENDYD